MSTNDKPPAQQGQQQNIPPPPPGPPPAQATDTGRPKHSNETPLPDYEIPPYNPADSQFAPPPGGDDDIYNASPVDDKPPKWGFHGHHRKDSDAKKKSNRLSALGEAFTSKVAGPVNALANRFGAEGFLPESLDKECEKAARILRAFCNGIYTDAIPTTSTTTTTAAQSTETKPGASPKPAAKKSRTLLTIPSKVIARAQGLAIFTAVRLGFQATGSSGSGILIARLPDGSWSPPSAIQVTSIGAGFVAGVDIYDCVVVINTRQALELFTKTRMSLGSDLAVTAGPFGVGGALDWGVPPPEGKSAAGTKAEPAAATTAAPPAAPATSPLSADNTHFTTPLVPADVLSSDEEPASSSNKGKGKAKDKTPNALREALKKPVYSYVKSRGLFAGIQVDGTVIVSRDNANARFYGQSLTVKQILAGEVPAIAPTATTTTTTTTATGATTTVEEKPKKGLPWPAGTKPLYEVLRAAESGWAQKQAQAQAQAVQTQGQDQTQPPTTTTTTTTQPTEPQQIWIPPPPPAPQTTTTTAAGDATRGATTGAQTLSATGASTSSGLPAEYLTPAAQAKAAEAAAEAEAARAAGLADDGDMPPPPAYFDEPHPVPPGGSGGAGAAGTTGGDMPPPPAYEDSSRPQGFVPDRKA
ncbi:hypothetical protein VTJ49DRAFT_5148 [Mycothermus thermophilus]|uniref:Ysc84 actin-binding domain-containing protein n=1 Tax=Humicola insolens TaxID=85995 RepID=A0ABR3V3X0_HUMIN